MVCVCETPPYRANILTRSINSDEKSVQLTLTMTYDYEEIIVKCQVSYIIFKKRKIIINKRTTGLQRKKIGCMVVWLQNSFYYDINLLERVSVIELFLIVSFISNYHASNKCQVVWNWKLVFAPANYKYELLANFSMGKPVFPNL